MNVLAKYASIVLMLLSISTYLHAQPYPVCFADVLIEDGNAALIAVDNGDITCEELHLDTKRTLYKGSALAILRAGQKAGTVKFIAECEGLKAVEVVLQL